MGQLSYAMQCVFPLQANEHIKEDWSGDPRPQCHIKLRSRPIHNRCKNLMADRTWPRCANNWNGKPSHMTTCAPCCCQITSTQIIHVPVGTCVPQIISQVGYLLALWSDAGRGSALLTILPYFVDTQGGLASRHWVPTPTRP